MTRINPTHDDNSKHYFLLMGMALEIIIARNKFPIYLGKQKFYYVLMSLIVELLMTFTNRHIYVHNYSKNTYHRWVWH